jgi:hypothetical protein
MKSVFRVLEVFRPAQRSGPILVGKTPSVRITVGTRLIASDDPTQVLEVLAVDLPTTGSVANGQLAIVVKPDLGKALRPGALFQIVNGDTGP